VIPDIRLPTAGDPDEYGESALDFAMPWAEIDPTEFEPVADLEPLIELARHRHEMRLESDEELVSLVEDLADWEAEGDRETISLLESERRKEMKEAEERRAERFGADDDMAMADDIDGGDNPVADDGDAADGAEGEPGAGENEGDSEGESEAEEEDDEDLYLQETARILSDLIDLDQERLLAHRQTP
jgi:carboxyl-terminal processing protease